MTDVEKINTYTTLFLGSVGENKFRQQQIDVTAWLSAWPGATVSAVFFRPDGQLYTVAADITSSPLVWTPGAADLAVAGDGKLELRIITADGVVGKSAIISTVTHGSLGAVGDPPTPPAPDWTANVAANATEARTAATDAQQAAQTASDAQRAINTAEPDRVLAEQERAAAESERASAESGRATAESNRSTAESGRQTAENNRSTAEQNRVTAETNRDSEEITRGQNESTRQSNESTRQSNESARVSAENTRAAFYSGFGASISELSADTKFPVTNLITNGDFSNGTTGWSTYKATISASANKLSITTDGSAAYGMCYQATSTPSVVGHKYYFSARCAVTNSACTSIYIDAQGATAGGFTGGKPTISNPISGTQYRLSGVLAAPSDVIGTVQVKIRHTYVDAATASGKVMEAQYVSCIDLTAAFCNNVVGTGNEPTAAEMDAMLAVYPNSWFDGTVNFGANPRMLPYLLNQTRNRPIIASGTYAARPTSVTFPTLYLSTDKTAGSTDRLTLNLGGSTWLQI